MRTIRPIGKVTTALKRHGYRQQAVIVIDGDPLPHVKVLSKQVGNKVKFEGHYIDGNGELHKTDAFVDAKRAASSIVALREQELAKHAPAAKKAAAKTQRASRRAAKKPAPRERTSSDVLIDCKGCGTLHRDDDACPW